MGYFGIPFRNGVPIGLGSIVSFGAQQFDPSELFVGGTAGAWYDPSDLTTMFTTSAGTTPVAMPGLGSAVSVGLMLDKSQGLQRFWSGYFDGSGDWLDISSSSAFGYGTGDFTIELWAYFTSINVSTPNLVDQREGVNVAPRPTIYLDNGTLRYYASGNNRITGPVLSKNVWYHIALCRSSGTTRLFVNGLQVGSDFADSISYTDSPVRVFASRDASPAVAQAGYCSNLRIVKGTALYTGTFTPPSPVTGLTAISGTSLLTCQNSTFIDNSSNAFAITVNGNTTTSQNIPLGNHAIAINDSTARPELRARVNLLTYSEEFQNAAWTKDGLNAFGSGSVANTTATTDPLGGNTADYIQENTANSKHRTYQALGSSGVSYTFSCYMKAGQRTWAYLNFGDISNRQAWFDLANGVLGTVSAGLVASIEAAGNGWYRCTVTRTASSVSPNFDVGIANADNVHTYTGDGTSGIYIWGADLRPANIGANVPAYQRIADANTYDTTGFPLYLVFDGIDDGMYTPANLNLSATDKVGVFAGVRKLSDAATAGIIVELSAAVGSNNGTFLISNFDVGGVVGPRYNFWSKGTGSGLAFANGFAAPITNVVDGIGDISGDSSILRVNGAQVAISTADQGTGNYGTYPLYIGSRANSSLWFQGHLHGLIVVGSAVSAGNISATESWMAQKTGIVIP